MLSLNSNNYIPLFYQKLFQLEMKSPKDSSGGGMSRAAMKRKNKKDRTSLGGEVNDINILNIPVTPISEPLIDRSILSTQSKNKSIIDDSSDSLNDILNSKTLSRNDKQVCIFNHLITPMCDIDEFNEQYFEKQPLLCTRENSASHFKGLFSKKSIENIIRSNILHISREIDIISEQEKKIVMLQPAANTNTNSNGKVSHKMAWVRESAIVEAADESIGQGSEYEISYDTISKHITNSNVLRLLCPHKYNDKLWKYISHLESHFNVSIGCHAYLIPTGLVAYDLRSDHKDGYIIQIEGNSIVEVYKPSNDSQMLPRATNINIQPGDYSTSGKIRRFYIYTQGLGTFP